MKIIYDTDNWEGEAIVATIGFFDGVHVGHRFLLDEMRALAAERNLPSAVVTFLTHPRIVLQADYQPRLLNSFREKIYLLEQTGIDYVIIEDFNLSLAALSAREYIENVLHKELNVKCLLVGHDHRFGHLRSEGFEQYQLYGKNCGMEIVRAPAFSDNGVAVSSSTVRRLIEGGNMSAATRLLGYSYCLRGYIVKGYNIGRSLGFPTANIDVDGQFKIIPLNGSYAVWATIDDKRYKGMLYIGSRPTFYNGDSVSVEVNVFDFSGDLYNKYIKVELVEYIREEMKLDSLDSLKELLQEDKIRVNEILNH
ncbi:MAG: riboflavin biosynthesis protein RibF [Tannerella sp.]|nr:riboflavin biosynthesis protein RibF [Tannerella sp.]